MGDSIGTRPPAASRRQLIVGAGSSATALALRGVSRAAGLDLLAAQAFPIRSIEPDDEDYEDLQPFGEDVGDARIVQLGECSHGAGVDFKAKVRLIKFLHTRLGFDVLVWESGLHAMRRVGAGLRAGVDPVVAAQRGVFTIWSAAAEVKPLFDYAKASQATARPLEMAGFDCQFTARGADQALADDLRAFCQPLEDPALRGSASADAESAVAAYAKIARRAGTEADLRSGQAAADRLLRAMDRRRSAFVHVHGAREVGFMARAVESLRAVMALTFDTLPGAPGAVSAQSRDKTGFFNRREAQNARNLRWLAAEGYPGRKLIVWAHNVHVMNVAFEPNFAALRGEPQPRDMAPMGHMIAAAFGQDVYTVAITSFSGDDRWVNSKAAPTQIPSAPPGSLEARLHDLRRPYLFLRTRDLDPAASQGLAMRVFVPAPGSSPSSPRGVFSLPNLAQAVRGVLFIDEARAATPLPA